MKLAAVILAAGQGTRMKSKRAKVLQPLCGRPLLAYSVDLGRAVSEEPPIVVVGHEADEVRRELGDGGIRYVVQAERLGTAHALMQAADLLRTQVTTILVWYADMPLLAHETMSQLISRQQQNAGPLSMATVVADDPRGFGRVLRAADGGVQAIVEEAHASPAQRAIRELNVGAYCFDAEWLLAALAQLSPSPKGEYYLTDLIAAAAAQGQPIATVTITDPAEAIGINTRVHLAEAEAFLRQRINRVWMEQGVAIVDPATTYIDADVVIGQDSIILPNTHLLGRTTIGDDCVVGPNSVVRDTTVGNRCAVDYSVLEGAVLEDEVDIGPFGHLRKGAHLARGVHLGNFGEVKNSYLGPGVKMGHFSYVGDATIGARTNIGAGTVTCNFGADGKKNRTEVGEDVFIGSDSLLVAPVTLGARARTGAGSVVTKDVPADALAVGVPARLVRTAQKGDETLDA